MFAGSVCASRSSRSISGSRSRLPIESAERFASTRWPLGGQADCLDDHPAIDLADQPVLLGDRQKAPGQDDLAARPDHPQQQLLARLAAAEGNDRL